MKRERNPPKWDPKIVSGRELSGVRFYRDVVDLQFDPPPTLFARGWPVIDVGGIEFRFGMTGYRDALCGRIGSAVRTVSVCHELIRLEFEDDSRVIVSI